MYIDGNLPWWGLLIILAGVLIIFVIIPWNKIFKKRKKDDEFDPTETNKTEKVKPKKSSKPIWGLYNGFGKKQSIRAKEYVYVEEKEDSCELCRPFENKILCLDKLAKNVYTMEEAVERGYHHIGCSHVDIDYFQGTTVIPENKWTSSEKEKRFKLKLEQFKFEDDIRKNKYQIEESTNKEEKEMYQKKLKTLENKYIKFLSESGLKRRKDKEKVDIPDYDKFI